MTLITVSPVVRAREEAKRKSDQYGSAKQALIEQVRTSDGYVAGGLVDQVADSTSIPAPVVQRAMWDLMSHGELTVDDQLALRLPETLGR